MTPAAFGRVVRQLTREVTRVAGPGASAELIKNCIAAILIETDPGITISRVDIQVRMSDARIVNVNLERTRENSGGDVSGVVQVEFDKG